MLVLWKQILAPFFKLLALTAGVAGALLGLCLMVRPAATLARAQSLNRWVSSRRALKPLEMPRGTDRQVRGRRLWAGLVIAGGSAYILFVLLWSFDAARLAAAIGGDRVLTRILVDWIRWSLVAGSLLVAAVGLMLALAPQVLESFEAWSNRWISTRRALQGADAQYLPLDSLVERFPRATGALLLVFSVAAAIASLVLLAQR